jgi:hypothetical protein
MRSSAIRRGPRRGGGGAQPGWYSAPPVTTTVPSAAAVDIGRPTSTSKAAATSVHGRLLRWTAPGQSTADGPVRPAGGARLSGPCDHDRRSAAAGRPQAQKPWPQVRTTRRGCRARPRRGVDRGLQLGGPTSIRVGCAWAKSDRLRHVLEAEPVGQAPAVDGEGERDLVDGHRPERPGAADRDAVGRELGAGGSTPRPRRACSSCRRPAARSVTSARGDREPELHARLWRAERAAGGGSRRPALTARSARGGPCVRAIAVSCPSAGCRCRSRATSR